MRIARLLVISVVLLTIVTAAAVGGIAALTVRNSLLPAEIETQGQRVARLATQLQGDVDAIVEDVLVLREAIPDIAPNEEQQLSSEQRAGITRALHAMMLAKPNYLQARLIGVADEGREVVRVERTQSGGTVSIVPQAELQRKGARPYFIETIRQAPSATYVSPAELNREHSAIQVPHVPVVRVGTPVWSSDGRLFGALLINVDLRPAFDALRHEHPGRVYVVDHAGNYVVHPDRSREFAHELGTAPAKLVDDLPELAATVASGGRVATELDIGPDQHVVAAVQPANLGGRPWLSVVAVTPSAAATAWSAALRPVIMTALVTALLSGALAIYAVQVLLVRPLRIMTETADRLPGEGTLNFPAFGAIEIDKLARALVRMNRSIAQKNADLVLRERQFRRLVEGASTVTIMLDEQGDILLANGLTEATFGFAPGELVGKPIGQIVPYPFREAHATMMAEFKQRPEIRSIGAGRPLFAVHKDGREVPVEVKVNPIETPEGLRIVVSLTDITASFQAAAAARRLAAIVQSSSDAILSKDLEGIITSWNAGAEGMFGYEESEAVGSSITVLYPDDRIEEEESILKRIRNNERIAPFETMRRRKDGTLFHASVAISPLLDGSGTVVGASTIVRDISELKNRDADLKRANVELERSNVELEQFAYVASHDLQEPLRMVANYTELLAERYQGRLDDKADKYIHFASDGAHRMQRLVRDLLAYSRVGSQGKDLVPVDLDSVVDDVLSSLRALLREFDVRIERDPLPTVLADATQLRQLFQNLMENAVKFRSASGPVVAIRVRCSEGRYEISIQDNGIGMDMQHADRVFQMFQRLHGVGEYEGSGIGLAIAKRIVERHRGRIWLESEPGAGLTVHFTLMPAERRPGVAVPS